MNKYFPLVFILTSNALLTNAQAPKPEDTEYYSPVPKVVTPGENLGAPPSDAIVLFNGKDMEEWCNDRDSLSSKKWHIENEYMTVDKSVGDLRTKRKFTNFQLHIEYRIPFDIQGTGQSRGNSGIFLASLPRGAGGYELQVLDSYNNSTYVNGQSGSIYKQAAPLVNACRKPGEWQCYDVVWVAPRFHEDGTLKSAAKITVFHNGVLIQNNFVLNGDTPWIGAPSYRKHGAAPLKLQAHRDPSKPISYRNIWLRELPADL